MSFWLLAHSLLLRFEPGRGFPHPVISLKSLPRRSGTDSPLNPGQLPSVHVLFMPAANRALGMKKEGRSFASKSCFPGAGPTRRSTITFQSDTCYGRGMQSSWTQGGVASSPTSGKERIGKAWRERKRLDYLLKVTVSLRAGAWGLLLCSGNCTRQGRRARKRRSLRKSSSQFQGLWRRERLEDKGKAPLKGILNTADEFKLYGEGSEEPSTAFNAGD